MLQLIISSIVFLSANYSQVSYDFSLFFSYIFGWLCFVNVSPLFVCSFHFLTSNCFGPLSRCLCLYSFVDSLLWFVLPCPCLVLYDPLILSMLFYVRSMSRNMVYIILSSCVVELKRLLFAFILIHWNVLIQLYYFALLVYCLYLCICYSTNCRYHIYIYKYI